jgi:hypothetical protein
MGHTINPQYQKSTLSAYTDTEFTSNQEAIPFNNIDILTGCSIQTTPGNTVITLVNPGIYEICLEAQLASGATNTSKEASNPDEGNQPPSNFVTSTGAVGIQLYSNDTAIPGAESSTQPATSEYGAVSITKLIRVKPSCPMIDNNIELTFVTTTDDTLVQNVNLTIIKIC